MEPGNHLLWVDETDIAFGQDILDDKAHLLDSLTSHGHGLVHAEMVGDIMKIALGGQLHGGNDHPLLQSEGWPQIDILACDVGGQLDNNVHEGGLVHAESLDPLFAIPGVQDNPLPPVIAGGTDPNGLEVMPGTLGGLHGTLAGLVLVSHMKVSSPVQVAWWVQGTVDCPTQEIWLLAWSNKLHPMVSSCSIISRVVQGDKQDTP